MIRHVEPKNRAALWYMITHPIEEYRCVGPANEADGRRLIRVRFDPVSQWEPVPIEWVPETIPLAIGDFPKFWSGILCISPRALDCLQEFLRPAGELLPLTGTAGPFVGFHCLQKVDAVHAEETEQRLKARKGMAFASPTFAPALHATRLGNADVFRVPESFLKIFVSARVRTAYERCSLTGLEFIPVPLV